MQCPIDGTTLDMSERQGIEIDYCPQCRGVWLDRGELDKLIVKSEGQTASYVARENASDDRYLDDRQRESNEHYTGRYAASHKKRGSFLSDIFDFGD